MAVGGARHGVHHVEQGQSEEQLQEHCGDGGLVNRNRMLVKVVIILFPDVGEGYVTQTQEQNRRRNTNTARQLLSTSVEATPELSTRDTCLQ